MGADKSAKNTPNAPKFICPSPKVWDFDEKRLHRASVVCGRQICWNYSFIYSFLQTMKEEVDSDPQMARAAVYYLLILEDQLVSRVSQ